MQNKLKEFLNYQEAKKYAQSFKLKNRDEWLRLTKSKDFQKNIPKNPDRFYKEFPNWIDFLHGQKGKWLNYKEAKKIVISLKLKGKEDWFANRHKLPSKIPKNPQQTYSNFEGWGKFLGTGIIASHKKKFPSFNKVRKYARSKNVSSILNWYKHTKTEKYPNNFPKAPRSAYKKEWKGWPDFLGKKK